MHGTQCVLVCPEVRRRSDTHNLLCSDAEAVADAVALACAARGTCTWTGCEVCDGHAAALDSAQHRQGGGARGEESPVPLPIYNSNIKTKNKITSFRF